MTTAPQNSLSPSGSEAGKNRRTGKAVLAGVVAVGLLAAGGGTFAKWHETDASTPGILNTGQLSMDVQKGTAGWSDASGAPIDPATFKMVPGDTVVYSATVTTTVEGTNLQGVLTVDPSGLTSGDDAVAEQLEHTIQINGSAPVKTATADLTVTETQDVRVEVAVTWPEQNSAAADGNWGTDGKDEVTGKGAGELDTIALESLNFTLSQA